MIRNLMKPDYRTRKWREVAKQNREIERSHQRNFWIGLIILALLSGFVLSVTLYDIKHRNQTLPEALKQTIVPEVVKVVEAKEISWNDAIRQVFPEDEAGRMIRICLKEHEGWKGNPRYALNDKNTNGSWDYGWCQVNSVHKPASMSDYDWKLYLEDPVNHAKEVRKIFLSQWWNAWSVYKFKGVR